MNRILFLVRERTGSTFLTSCLLAQNGIFLDKNNPKAFKNIEYPTWIPTIPEKQLAFWWNGWPDGRILEDMIMQDRKLETHEAYMWNPPAKLAPSFYDSLSGNWKFIYLIRDPRNRAESITQRGESGYPEGSKERAEFRELLLFSELKSYALELQSVAKMLDDDNFYLLKFEDFIISPVEKFDKIMQFCDVTIDKEFYVKHIERQVKDYTNTSFKDNGKQSNERWKLWTPEEKERAVQIIGKELILFDYEKDDDWSKQ